MTIHPTTLQIVLAAISTGINQILRGRIPMGVRTIREAQKLLRDKAVSP